MKCKVFERRMWVTNNMIVKARKGRSDVRLVDVANGGLDEECAEQVLRELIVVQWQMSIS